VWPAGSVQVTAVVLGRAEVAGLPGLPRVPRS
jgi:hypothetical protein